MFSRLLAQFRVQDFRHLVLVLYAACGCYDCSILEIHCERQSHERCTARQIFDKVCRRDVKILVIECDMRIYRFQFFHNSIDREAHWSHSATANHGIFIVFHSFHDFLFRFQMFQICVQHLVSPLEILDFLRYKADYRMMNRAASGWMPTAFDFLPV